MGHAQPEVSERENPRSPELHQGKVFAQNTGVCMEDPLAEGEVALNLGSGALRWDGWVNIDGFNDRADLRCDLKKLPYPDNHADRIIAVHVFEHFYLWETDGLLDEWRRVLKPGGKLILELPCMDKVCTHIQLRLNKGVAPAPFMSWLAFWGDPKYEDPAMCHKWGYFKHDMEKILLKRFVSMSHEPPRYHFIQRDMRVTAIKGA